MRGKAKFVVTAAAALFVTFSVLAQNAPDPAKKTEPAPTKDADNTARNVEDRGGQTLTPIDQGNSKADIAMTAQIRKEVVAAKNMSVNAQNVKIITNGGKVTLRGPVNTVEEKRLIGEIAAKYAQPGNVDDQLEVQAGTDSELIPPTAPNKPKGD
jgi:osmotically-inducible protein OsmY